MNREQLLEKLAGLGFSAEVAKGMSDEQLGEILRVMEKPKAAEMADEEGDDDAGDEDESLRPDDAEEHAEDEDEDEDKEDFKDGNVDASRKEQQARGAHSPAAGPNSYHRGPHKGYGEDEDENIRAHAEGDDADQDADLDDEGNPHDEAAMDALPDDQKAKAFSARARRYAAKYSAYMDKAEGCTSHDESGSDKLHGEPMKMSEIEQHVHKIVAAAVGEVKKEFTTIKRSVASRAANERRKAIESFCEQMSKEGRIPPFEKHAWVRNLLRCDPSTVYKFAEKVGGKDVEAERTELEQEMAVLRRRPTKFVELIKAHDHKENEGGEESKVERVFEAFSERFAQVSPQLTKESFVQGFKNAKKINPKITAKEYVPASMYEAVA